MKPGAVAAPARSPAPWQEERPARLAACAGGTLSPCARRTHPTGDAAAGLPRALLRTDDGPVNEIYGRNPSSCRVAKKRGVPPPEARSAGLLVAPRRFSSSRRPCPGALGPRAHREVVVDRAYLLEVAPSIRRRQYARSTAPLYRSLFPSLVARLLAAPVARERAGGANRTPDHFPRLKAYPPHPTLRAARFPSNAAGPRSHAPPVCLHRAPCRRPC